MSIREAEVEDGVAVWHARTVPELADAVRLLAGRLAEVEPAPPPDLSGYVPRAEFDALEDRLTALEASVATLDTEVDAQGNDLTALEDRVAALENPPAP